jgi:hypothetical protein
VALPLQVVFDGGHGSEVARIGDETNVKGRCLETACMMIVGNGILVCVAGAVVSLRRIPNNA